MCKSEETIRQQDTPYTHFMQPRHDFTLGEEIPEPVAEQNSRLPGEE